MNPRRIVVKVGGSTLGEHDTTLRDLVALHREGYQPIVVHGGGKTITEWLERQGVTSRFAGGLRVTDEASIDVVVAILAGLVNKQLTVSLNALGGRAVGLCGADGGILRARIKDPALGLVGEICRVEAGLLEGLLRDGYLPVIAPIGLLEEDGGVTETLLNINADTAAADIGAALEAEQFLFLTDVPGVSDAGGTVLPRLSREQVQSLIASGAISGGMLPKVAACLRALEHVPVAVVMDGRRPHAIRDSMAGLAIGTRIERVA